MGFLGYYRSYIADSAKTAKPLYELLTKPSMCKMKESGKKGSPSSQASPSQPVEWDRETSGSAGEADCKLEKLIASWGRVVKPTHYGVPRFREAICSSRGCVKRRARSRIVPTTGRKLRVVGYGSWTLTPAEKNYRIHSGKLEFLGLEWAITERFHGYLFHAPHFTVYNDNNPLT